MVKKVKDKELNRNRKRQKIKREMENKEKVIKMMIILLTSIIMEV
jgi:hypothetical protein